MDSELANGVRYLNLASNGGIPILTGSMRATGAEDWSPISPTCGPPDRFVYGPENQLAAKLLDDLLREQVDFHDTNHDVSNDATFSNTWHPLTIWAPPGFGKSHLLRGIVHRFAELGRQTITTTAEEFVRELNQARQTRSLEEFRRFYRDASLVAVEGLDRLSQRPSPQREFAALIEVLDCSSGMLVSTALRPVMALPNLNPSVRSRLTEGISLPLVLPCRATRKAMVQQWLTVHQQSNSNQPRSSGPESTIGNQLTPEMSSVLEDLCAGQDVSPRQLWKRFVAAQLPSRAIPASSSETTEEVPLQHITSIVARCFSVTRQELLGRSRRQSIVEARGIAIFLARELTSHSLSEIGARFKGRDHSTVLHAYRKTAQLVATDPAIRQTVDDIRRVLVAT